MLFYKSLKNVVKTIHTNNRHYFRIISNITSILISTDLFSPVCVLRCRCSSSLLVNRFPQNNQLHTKGRSPVGIKINIYNRFSLIKFNYTDYLCANVSVPLDGLSCHRLCRIQEYDMNVYSSFVNELQQVPVVLLPDNSDNHK